MPRIVLASGFLFVVLAVAGTIGAQNQPSSSSAKTDSTLTVDYPANRAGVLIQGSSWQALGNQMPTKTKIAHSVAAGLSYGVVPGKIVAEYDGEHAPTQVDAGPIVICICHILSLPGEPVIVQLHPKKGARELDGGRMTIYPVVGGSKMGDANKSDLIPASQAHPEEGIWLISPQAPLAPGEYALMLGTQNFSIYPFTVAPPAASSAGTK